MEVVAKTNLCWERVQLTKTTLCITLNMNISKTGDTHMFSCFLKARLLEDSILFAWPVIFF